MNTIDWGKIYCYMKSPWGSWGNRSNILTIENEAAPDCLVQQIDCDELTPYSGGESFPTILNVNLGSSLGTVTLTFNADNIPDKFVVIFDGEEVINTGYRGASSYQNALDAALIARGEPTETIAGVGAGTADFSKTTSTSSAQIKVYAPLSGTGWNLTLGCPV